MDSQEPFKNVNSGSSSSSDLSKNNNSRDSPQEVDSLYLTFTPTNTLIENFRFCFSFSVVNFVRALQALRILAVYCICFIVGFFKQ